MVAAIARYHRRSLPKKRHESWQLIEGREERRTVTSLALFLRLAVALDRRPEAAIERFAVRQEGSGVLVVTLEPRLGPDGILADLSLERWSLLACAPVVLEVTGLQLQVPGAEA
jgi:exopolyphosphatase/guanosine-5'-triphosphate,3'-diphosphate pyrophosphatase